MLLIAALLLLAFWARLWLLVVRFRRLLVALWGLHACRGGRRSSPARTPKLVVRCDCRLSRALLRQRRADRVG